MRFEIESYKILGQFRNGLFKQTLFNLEGIMPLQKEINLIWGCSSAGRAPALQAGGQEFDSPHLHQRASEDGNDDRSPRIKWACSSGG